MVLGEANPRTGPAQGSWGICHTSEAKELPVGTTGHTWYEAPFSKFNAEEMGSFSLCKSKGTIRHSGLMWYMVTTGQSNTAERRRLSLRVHAYVCTHAGTSTITHTPWNNSRLISTADKPPVASVEQPHTCHSLKPASHTWALWETGYIPHITVQEALGSSKVLFGLCELWASWKTRGEKKRQHPTPLWRDSE